MRGKKSAHVQHRCNFFPSTFNISLVESANVDPENKGGQLYFHQQYSRNRAREVNQIPTAINRRTNEKFSRSFPHRA